MTKSSLPTPVAYLTDSSYRVVPRSTQVHTESTRLFSFVHVCARATKHSRSRTHACTHTHTHTREQVAAEQAFVAAVVLEPSTCGGSESFVYEWKQVKGPPVAIPAVSVSNQFFSLPGGSFAPGDLYAFQLEISVAQVFFVFLCFVCMTTLITHNPPLPPTKSNYPH